MAEERFDPLNASDCRFLYHLLKTRERRRIDVVNSALLAASVKEEGDKAANFLTENMIGKTANALEDKYGRAVPVPYVTGGSNGWKVDDEHYVTESLTAELIIAIRDCDSDRFSQCVPQKTVEDGFLKANPKRDLTVVRAKIDWGIKHRYLKRPEHHEDYIGLGLRAHDDMGYIDPLARWRQQLSGSAVAVPTQSARQAKKQPSRRGDGYFAISRPGAISKEVASLPFDAGSKARTVLGVHDHGFHGESDSGHNTAHV